MSNRDVPVSVPVPALATIPTMGTQPNDREEIADEIAMAGLGSPSTASWVVWLKQHLNFYRIHLLVFTFVPLVFSVVFWAANGKYKLAYIDALFLCYSAFTNAGLASVDLSRTTSLQQAMLFIQMFFGSMIFVSWVVVLVRKYVHLVKRVSPRPPHHIPIM
ncbi:low affinity potassium transporter [Serendipita sp. 398]|nr:low affinity potassium transporter [Serendipita sp. 398]